ncbi:MAG TPA: ABC transporter permease [Actinomycetota bacterium]|nr:ABC transporter permease [Actinomycetota bacterium]
MSAVRAEPVSRPQPVKAGSALRDILAVTGRNLTSIRRVPQLLVFTLIQPVIFVVLFRYVMGGAIEVPGGSYVNYLIPGIFIQTVTFGALQTAIGMAADIKSGLLERFRSLPMSGAAVLAGRTTADLFRNIVVVMLIAGVGFLVGFRVQTSAMEFIAGLLLCVLFSYVLSWVFATVGLLVGDPESAQAAAFPVMAPFVFASSAFVAVESMPDWLQGFARNQPVSVVASAVRALSIGQLPGTESTSYYVTSALLWCAGILVVMMPLAIWRYRKTV